MFIRYYPESPPKGANELEELDYYFGLCELGILSMFLLKRILVRSLESFFFRFYLLLLLKSGIYTSQGN